MVTPTQQQRAQPPIRWPRPDLVSVALVLLWVAGVVLALFVPATIVSPSVRTAPGGDVWRAFSAGVAGSVVMVAAAFLLWWHRREAGVLLMGAVPAFSCLAGASIMAAAKLTGT